MLSGLGGERALSFPKDSPEERKRLGLEAPALDATFTPEGGGAVRLRLSKVTEGGSEKAYALREDAGGALLAEVPVSALGHLDKKAAELRDRTVLAFDKGLVHRLGFTQAGGGAEVVVEKAESPDAGGDDWKVAAPEKGPAKKWKMSSVVWTLGSLKAAAFGEKPKDWAKYGIDGRSRAATVYDAQGRVLARLQVGKDVPGKPGTVYARGTQDTVLELETQRLAELPTTVEDVLDRPSAPTAATEGQDGGMSGANTGGTPFGGPLQQ
jgi:hypothetical protein